ncbi:transglutaminase superfamily protein [Labedella gwakjiensis]|uniref:Transglutaminase family protein n=1 Tax=Labedella gwakjiensis TaxID=390269 RepID=A0A2P8GT37_9MICO|nr:transglutaminase family protein [Labedella gwakjiensis]PSL37127.1 transglutaminase superfamily protein [Labedella gwakjiensis]RUQ81971.1 transglutaminase family protein [Labedella gwakjiensis]
MQRRATAHLRITVQTPVRLALIVAAASGQQVSERLDVRLDGSPFEPRELATSHGTRLHVIDAEPSRLEIDYAVDVTGMAEPAPVDDVDLLTYVRPSRYCESDTLAPTARAEFAGLSGLDLLAGVSSWVGSELRYVPGSSGPTDGATQTLLARQGVCRDYAHLVIALLRALDVPARLAAVYAPGLDPMDFHAVAEAYVDGAWHVVDATTLAPRQSLVRIATGRDAADTAFLSTYHGFASLDEVTVTATVDELPRDDVRELAELR